jgi:hypothetical protein
MARLAEGTMKGGAGASLQASVQQAGFMRFALAEYALTKSRTCSQWLFSQLRAFLVAPGDWLIG